MENIFNNLRGQDALVHCISNYVTVNDLANIILAAGASPIMADEKDEIGEIVSLASGLLVNIGTLNRRTEESIYLACERANQLGLPIVLDPVGVGVSLFRQEAVDKILKNYRLALIKANASEMKYLYNRELSRSGVDVDLEDRIDDSNLEDYISMARELSRRYETIIAITGPIDIISDGTSSYIVRNGNSYMERITGAGCMLGGVLTASLASNKDRLLEATVLGIIMMGLAGDYAREDVDDNRLGLASFRTALLDWIGKLDYRNIEEDGRFEKR